MAPKRPHRTALVLSGGGARGAYEAGVIHYIRTAIAPKLGGERTFDVLCGSSVGAINICLMAALAHSPKDQGKMIYKLWKDLKQDQIYKRNLAAMGELLGRTTKGISSNLLKINPFKPTQRKTAEAHFRGFLDSSPLPAFIESMVPFYNIEKNLKKKILAAVSLTATNVATGHMELFVQKRADVEYTGEYLHRFVELTAMHAAASAAIPIIFPPVMVNNVYYTDGGLKLNTPMSPAIQLGADKIMILGLHHRYEQGEQLLYSSPANQHPTLGQLVGLVMNALFLDRIQYDIDQLTRINRLVQWSEKVYGADYLDKINSMLTREGIKGDIANRGLSRIEVFKMFPSRDVSGLFSECYQDEKSSNNSFNVFEKLLLRLLDIDPAAGVDILSYLAFMPSYIHKLLELGYDDAASHRDEIIEFLTSDPRR